MHAEASAAKVHDQHESGARTADTAPCLPPTARAAGDSPTPVMSSEAVRPARVMRACGCVAIGVGFQLPGLRVCEFRAAGQSGFGHPPRRRQAGARGPLVRPKPGPVQSGKGRGGFPLHGFISETVYGEADGVT